ncbi:MAG TPA: FAD-binding oxidoreductase, partial [Gemmatimonadaceae bacterium]|nr:FAD-binding oxidoreductase [Gemmatimonadaceae bacterium]
RHPGLGSTSASTALLQYELDESLVDLTEKLGRHRATEAYRAALAGVRSIGRICRGLSKDVGFRRRPTLYYASRTADAKQFQRERDARVAIGLPCEMLSGRELRSIVDFNSVAALTTNAGAEIDPWRFTKALLARARDRGADVFSRTETQRIAASGRHMEVRTNRGSIRAKYVVVATGYEAERFLPKSVAKLQSTYAIATEPVAAFAGWPDKSLIWESARPYLYMRRTEDNRIIVGGLDDPFRDPAARDRRVNSKARGLLLKARKLFPRIEMEIAFAWAGTFGETKDSLPYIGPHPAVDNRVLFALGYGANGIPFGAIAAELVAARICGTRHRFDHTFIFDR